MAAEIACDRITPELLDELAEAGEEFRKLKDSDDYTSLAAADVVNRRLDGEEEGP